jgi:LmbE family N-acetylglucosaminyl deacetylase
VNIDHLLTYNAVEVACRPTRSVVPNEIYGFEVVCSGSWKFDSSFIPNVFIDIERFWGEKLDAWKCYEGEDRPFPFPRSVEGLETLARYRGMASNLRFAEAFRLLRKVVK